MFSLLNFKSGCFLLSDGKLDKFSLLVLLRPHLPIIYDDDFDVDAKDADDYTNDEDDSNDDDAEDADDNNNDDDNDNNDDNKNDGDDNDLAIRLHQLSRSMAVPSHIRTLPDIIILCWYES